MSYDVREFSLSADEGGRSQAVAISGTSAQSAPINAETCLVHSTVDTFFRMGSNPTAMVNGTDMFLPQATTFRLAVRPGERLAFRTAGATGTVYITPERA